jgi:cytochrome P450
MSSDTAVVDLANPDAFVNGAPHEALAVLRRTDPVHWQPMDGEPGFWAVLRHADVAEVARHPEVFSASEGGVILENLSPEILAMTRNMLLAMDPPTPSTERRCLLLPGSGDRCDRRSGARHLPGDHGRRARPP